MPSFSRHVVHHASADERSFELITPVGYKQKTRAARLRDVQRRVEKLRKQCAKMIAADKAPSVLVEVNVPSEVPSDAPASKVHGE